MAKVVAVEREAVAKAVVAQGGVKDPATWEREAAVAKDRESLETVAVVKVVAMAAAARAAAAMGGAARGAVAMGAATAAERVREVASSATLRWSLIVRLVTLTAGLYGTECSVGLSVWPPRDH